jgi:hypothetical protein
MNQLPEARQAYQNALVVCPGYAAALQGLQELGARANAPC